MTDVKVRQLDDDVAAVLRARAKARGVSLEQEIRSTLRASVDVRRGPFLRRTGALQAAVPAPRRSKAHG